MDLSEVLQKLLLSYKQYYDIVTEDVLTPFKAEAKFVSHEEQYFLVRSAKLSDIDSTEHVYFATEKAPSLERLQELAKLAWEDGLKSVKPYYGHRNSDVTVLVLCEDCDKSVLKGCKKIKYSKTYKFMLYGWSNFKFAVIDVNSGMTGSNTQGSDLKKFLLKTLKKSGAIK